MNKKNLLEHHIHFLSKHRGERESLEHIELIHSDKSAFNIAFPLLPESIEAINPMFRMYLPDWIIPGEKTKVLWKKNGCLTYMHLPKHKNNWKTNNRLLVKKAGTVSHMEDFSLIQAKGFCETEDDFNEWYPWMRQQNMDNFNDSNQSFYIAYENEKPAGVCLCINHNCITGIYAVTTLTESRQQGISTTIMKQVVSDAVKNNAPLITLQVSTNSYAHSFYQHLGFENVFNCEIFTASN